jgi:hypothetical protein
VGSRCISARLACAALGLAAACAVATGGAGASDFERKSLTRIHDPVVVAGKRLLDLPQHHTSRLRLYRIEDGRLVAMPFQLDQRDDGGDLVVDGPRDFILDANDELVFMAKDAGDRAAADGFAEGCDGLLEIEIADPFGAGKGWAYLASYPSPPPLAPVEPYVVFDAATRQARSRAYRVDYADGRNYFTGLRIPRDAGGRDVNLLRQTRMHGSPTFSLLLTDWTLDFTEQNAIVEIDGVRAGPVRAVRRARLSVDLGSMFPELPSGTAYTYHYATSYLTPTRVRFPWIMLQALRDFRFENVFDFAPAALPVRYYDRDRPEGVTLTRDRPVDLRTTEDHDWWAHSADDRTMLHAMTIPESWRRWGVQRGTIVRAASRREDAGDADGGYVAGYTLLHMTNLREAGEYPLMQAAIALPRPYQAGDEAEPMAMLRAPLAVTVRRVR